MLAFLLLIIPNFAFSQLFPQLLPPANWLDWFHGIPGLIHAGVI